MSNNGGQVAKNSQDISSTYEQLPLYFNMKDS